MAAAARIAIIGVEITGHGPVREGCELGQGADGGTEDRRTAGEAGRRCDGAGDPAGLGVKGPETAPQRIDDPPLGLVDGGPGKGLEGEPVGVISEAADDRIGHWRERAALKGRVINFNRSRIPRIDLPDRLLFSAILAYIKLHDDDSSLYQGAGRAEAGGPPPDPPPARPGTPTVPRPPPPLPRYPPPCPTTHAPPP